MNERFVFYVCLMSFLSKAYFGYIHVIFRSNERKTLNLIRSDFRDC